MARPSRQDTPSDHVVTVRLTKAEREFLDDMVKATGWTASNILRTAFFTHPNVQSNAPHIDKLPDFHSKAPEQSAPPVEHTINQPNAIEQSASLPAVHKKTHRLTPLEEEVLRLRKSAGTITNTPLALSGTRQTNLREFLLKQGINLSSADLLVPMEQKAISALDKLTPRAAEIARLLLTTGLSYKEIADHIGISPKTAGKHVERIYRSLGVRSRSEMVAKCRVR